MKYVQMTYIGDELAYDPKVLTADEMVQRLAQVCSFVQAGHDYSLSRDVDGSYNTTAYHVHFRVPERDGYPEHDVHQIYRIEE